MVNNIGDVWKLFVQEPGLPSGSGGQILFPIFAKSPATAMQDFQNTSTCLQTAGIFVKSLCFGTVHARTVSNSWMGIEADVEIILNIIAVSRTDKLSMASKLPTFFYYVQEITNSLTNPNDARVAPL